MSLASAYPVPLHNKRNGAATFSEKNEYLLR